MTFTAASAGQLIKASVNNANLRHVGRLGDHFIPMDINGAGADNTYDLGSLTYQWKDFYFAGKLYQNGIEFKAGGGGGGGLENAEIKSWLEKQGIIYPFSNPGLLNESYTNTINLIITPRVSYSSGTTFIADINATLIDAMDATTGWAASTGGGTVSQDTTNKIEGAASVKITKASGTNLIDMVKTFTVFSLTDKQISFSVYLDYAGANLDYVQIILESSAGNTKSFRVQRANLIVGFNHITINPNTDTADASAGTFVPSSITKIYLGYYTNAAQTMFASFDYIVSVSDFILVDTTRKYKSFIFDNTNQEAIYINSVAGTGYHQRNTYTITALSNAYAVGSSYAIQRNVTIANNQGAMKVLSGAAAKTQYDSFSYPFNGSIAAQDIPWSLRFWDEEFKISTLPDTTHTKISSSTDKSGYFKSGDKVFLFHKRNYGTDFKSAYNSTVGANFKLVTLTADATHADTEITLTHAGHSNAGMNTSYWYAVRASVELLAIVENMTDNEAFVIQTPTIFTPKNTGISYPPGLVVYWDFDNGGVDKLGHIDATIGSNLILTTGKFKNAYTNFAANVNNKIQCPNNSFMDLDANTPFAVELWILLSPANTTGYAYNNWDGASSSTYWSKIWYTSAHNLRFGYLTAAQQGITVDVTAYESLINFCHIVWTFSGVAIGGGNNSNIYINANLVATGDIALYMYDSGGNVCLGLYNFNNTFPLIGIISEFGFWKTTLPSLAIIQQRYSAGIGRKYGFQGGYISRGILSAQTGNILRGTRKYSRQDTTNQNPIGYQNEFFVPGLTE